MNKAELIIKLLLVIFLFVCLLDMPYGYYQLTRFIALLAFSFLSFKSFEKHQKYSAFIYGALAILFQPIVKIYLGRVIWNVVDVLVGIGLIITILWNGKREIKK
jgi:hypothetical protein